MRHKDLHDQALLLLYEVEWYPSEIYAIYEYDLCRYNQVKMKSLWIMMTLNLTLEKTQKQTKGRGPINIEAETGMMQLQAKRCLRPPEIERDKEAFFCKAFRGNVALSRS